MKLLAMLVGLGMVTGGAFFAGLQVGKQGNVETDPTDDALAAAWMGGADRVGFEDPAGDARDLAVGMVAYGPSCRIGCTLLPDELSALGTDGPMFDVIEVAFEEETAEAFVVSLTLSSIANNFQDIVLPGGLTHRVGEFHVCWDPDSESATRCAILLASPHHDTVLLTSTFHIFGAEECGQWLVGVHECNWEVPYEVKVGTPGTIRFTIPKEYAGFDSAPLAIENLRATTGWFSANAAIPLWHLAWTARVPGGDEHDHQGLLEPANVADRTEPASDVIALAATDAPFWVDPARPVQSAGTGSILGAGSMKDMDELDLIAMDMHEEGAELVVQYALRGLEAMPTWDLQIATLIGIEGEEAREFGVFQANENAYGYAGKCISFGCHDAHMVPVSLDIAPGAPGVLTVRVPFSELGDPQPGARVTFLLTYTMYGETSHDVGEPGADGSANVHSGSIIDMVVGGVPFVFGDGHHGELPVAAGHDH